MVIYVNAHRGRGFRWECTAGKHLFPGVAKAALYADRNSNEGFCEDHLSLLKRYHARPRGGLCIPLHWSNEVRESAIKLLTVLFPNAGINITEVGDEYIERF